VPGAAVDHERDALLTEVWRNRALRRLLAGFAGLTLAETAFVTALAIHAFQTSGTLALGLVGARLLAGSLLGAVLGPMLEVRLGPRPLGRVAVARTGLLVAGAACVIAEAPLGAVLALLAIDAVVASPYRPAQARLLPSLAKTPGELSAAATGTSLVKTLSQAIGGLAGGALVAVASSGVVMAGAAAVMGAGALVVWTLRAPVRSEDQGLGRWAALRTGMTAIPRVLRHREASPLVVASGARTLVRGMWGALAVVVSLRVLHFGPSGVGVLQLAAGGGALLAVPVTISLIGRRHLTGPCVLAFVAAGLPLSLLGIVDLRVVAFVTVTIWGGAMAVSDAASISLLHRLLDGPTIADTVSVMETFKGATEGAGALVVVPLIAALGDAGAVVAAGLILPLVIAVAAAHVRRADSVATGRANTVALLHGVRELHPLDMGTLEQVAAGVHWIDVATGTDIIRSGEPGDEFYVIESGTADVIVGGYPVGRIGRGAGFGERALLRDAPRAATVRAVEPLALLVVERDDFLTAITGDIATPRSRGAIRTSDNVDLSDHPLAELLGRNALFARLAHSKLEDLAALASIERQPAGAVLVREGDNGDSVHIVVSGRVSASVAGVGVADLLAGDSFGEIAVLHGVPRQATLVAATDVVTCSIPGKAVVDVIGPLIGPIISDVES
jgi:CRP-like cAMP-binding protein